MPNLEPTKRSEFNELLWRRESGREMMVAMILDANINLRPARRHLPIDAHRGGGGGGGGDGGDGNNGVGGGGARAKGGRLCRPYREVHLADIHSSFTWPA